MVLQVFFPNLAWFYFPAESHVLVLDHTLGNSTQNVQEGILPFPAPLSRGPLGDWALHLGQCLESRLDASKRKRLFWVSPMLLFFGVAKNLLSRPSFAFWDGLRILLEAFSAPVCLEHSMPKRDDYSLDRLDLKKTPVAEVSFR